MSKLTIVANIKAKHDKIDFVKAELEKLIDNTRIEEGCLQYVMWQHFSGQIFHGFSDPAHTLLANNSH